MELIIPRTRFTYRVIIALKLTSAALAFGEPDDPWIALVALWGNRWRCGVYRARPRN